MKRFVEIQKLAPGTVFKATIMAGAIPFGGIAIILLLGMVIGGGTYGWLGTLIYFILAPIVIGLAATLYALSYNWLAPKFGGLKVEVADNNYDEDYHNEIINNGNKVDE